MQYFVVLGLLAAGACSKSGHKVRVAAAADLAQAFTELGAEFERRTGISLELEFGSSGLLAKQIEQGAPFALYAAANRAYVDQVVASGRCDGATAQPYARGQIVVWTPAGVTPPAQLADLADARFRTIAIANPAHAPYGRAARQALEKAGLWARVQDRIVLGENVQATLGYARGHNADAAVVARSIAVVTEGGAFLSIDPALHAPLDQAMVVCGGGNDAKVARQFSELVRSQEGREVMTRYGFLPPDEQLHSKAP
jgi:molybdate transport system substrate-binding protein